MPDRRKDRSFRPHELVQIAFDHRDRLEEEGEHREEDHYLPNFLLMVRSPRKGVDPTVALPLGYTKDGKIAAELPDQSTGEFGHEAYRPLYRRYLTGHHKLRIGKYVSTTTAFKWGLI